MKKTPIEGTIKSAYGKQLHELERREVVDGKPKADGNVLEKVAKGFKIEYTTEYDKLESKADAVAENEWPKNEEELILDTLNNKRIANAKQKQMQVEQDAMGFIRPSLENDVSLQLLGMFKILMASGKHTAESAKALAASNVGLSAWPDDLKA